MDIASLLYAALMVAPPHTSLTADTYYSQNGSDIVACCLKRMQQLEPANTTSRFDNTVDSSSSLVEAYVHIVVPTAWDRNTNWTATLFDSDRIPFVIVCSPMT
jgi:hypothetical protein